MLWNKKEKQRKYIKDKCDDDVVVVVEDDNGKMFTTTATHTD